MLFRQFSGNSKKRVAALYTAVSVTVYCSWAFCCGGGYVPLPYVPTSSGNINTPATKGSFFLIEKGSAGELFDIKKLQPLFRNIHQSGNERKVHHPAAVSVKADSSAAASDSARVSQQASKPAPVLNLHSIH